MWRRILRLVIADRCQFHCMRSCGSIGGTAAQRSGANELKTATNYRVEELHAALRIKVHKSLERWERLLFGVGVPAFFAYVSFNFLGRWSIVLAVAAAILLS